MHEMLALILQLLAISTYSYLPLTLYLSLPISISLYLPLLPLTTAPYLPLLHCRLFANILWQISLARNLVLHSQQAQFAYPTPCSPHRVLATLNYITPGKHMAQIIRQIDKSTNRQIVAAVNLQIR